MTRQHIQFEIETAKMRHDWAIAEQKRMGSTPALETFIEESGIELIELTKQLLLNASRQD